MKAKKISMFRELFELQPKAAKRKTLRRSYDPPFIPNEASNQIEEDVKSGAYRVNEVAQPRETGVSPWEDTEKRFYTTVSKKSGAPRFNLYSQETKEEPIVLQGEDLDAKGVEEYLGVLSSPETAAERKKTKARLTSTRRIDDE